MMISRFRGIQGHISLSRQFCTMATSRRKPQWITEDNISSITANYDTLLLDCDGVLWGADHITPIEGIAKAVDKLKSLGKRLLFVTNNSMHARQAYVDKFRTLPQFDAKKEDVFGVSYAAAIYLKDILKIKGKCYLVGSKGMAEELEEMGIPYIGYGPDRDEISDDPHFLMEMSKGFDKDIEVVLVGYDIHFNYTKLFKAASFLSEEKCAYIATNDKEITIKLGPLCQQPITGSLLPSISAASKREPIVLGKPYHHFLDCIKIKVPDIDLKRTLFVGDSLKTDIPFAKNSGMDSLLVLTGVSTLNHVNSAMNEQSLPTYIMDSFSSFIKAQ